MFKKKLSILFSICIGTFVLGACSSNGAKDNSDGKTEVKITWRNTGENDKLNKYLGCTIKASNHNSASC